MSFAPATRIGPYEVQTLLGAGGMGEVYRARDTRLQRLVALKVLRSDKAADPDRQSRLLQEARLRPRSSTRTSLPSTTFCSTKVLSSLSSSMCPEKR